MKTKSLVIVALLAFAAGGTCPSDVNNDGTVGINDFMQVLADWGPCPSPPRIVDMTFAGEAGENMLVRIWSDGVAEYRALHALGGHVWVELPENPDAPSVEPVAIDAGSSGHFWRLWADGTVDHIQFVVLCGAKDSCDLEIYEDWTNLPEPR